MKVKWGLGSIWKLSFQLKMPWNAKRTLCSQKCEKDVVFVFYKQNGTIDVPPNLEAASKCRFRGKITE